MDSYLDIETILLPKCWLFGSIHAVFTQTSGCSNMLLVLKCTHRQCISCVSTKLKVFSLLSWRPIFEFLHATALELSKECTIISEEKKDPFITKLTGRGTEVSYRILSCVQDFKRQCRRHLKTKFLLYMNRRIDILRSCVESIICRPFSIAEFVISAP